MHEGSKLLGGNGSVVIFQRRIGQASNETLATGQSINQSGASEASWCEVELRDLIHIPLRDTDDPVLAHTGMADDEDVEVRVEGARGLEPTPHFQTRSDGEDPCPFAEEGWGLEVIRMFDERLDPRVQLAARGFGGRQRWRPNRGVLRGSFVHHSDLCSTLFVRHMGYAARGRS